MAKRKAPRNKPPAGSVLSRVQGNLTRLQRDAEAILRRRRTEFERLVTRTSRELEKRSQRLLSTVEHRASKRLEPLVKRLAGRALASRKEVQSLSRQIQELEQVLKPHARSKAHVQSEKPSK
jgi:hypothetical protein